MIFGDKDDIKVTLDERLTPNHVYYLLPVQEVSHSPSLLAGCYFDHLRGSRIDPTEVQFYSKDSDRLEIKIHKYFEFDYRPRYWRLMSVWFDGKPIMICQNAGREGDDWEERFITDKQGFIEMVTHIKTLLNTPMDDKIEDVVDPDAQLGRKLIAFYGNKIDGYFQRYHY